MTLTMRIERIPSADVRLAQDNAALLDAMGIVTVRLIASPGAGKTSLILRTLESLGRQLRPAVIQGSLASPAGPTPLDEMDLPCVQVNTGGQPYLDANMVREALAQLPLADVDLLLIEEIGTLTSPSGLSLGETLRVVLVSLPEGEDCPLHYPEPFSHADAVVLNKLDLLPALEFDRPAFHQAVRHLNPQAPIFEVSCRTGQGLEQWEQWLLEQVHHRSDE